MTIKKFEQHIKHLNQLEVVTGTVSSLTHLLVDKGLVTVEELQEQFLHWMKVRGLDKKTVAQKKKSKK